MSRSGYSDNLENWDLIRWRGAVASSIRGTRGQAFLREMLAEMDALPLPRLVAHSLERGADVCAIGTVGRARGMDLGALEPEEVQHVAQAFGVAWALAAEIQFINDEGTYRPETPEQRFGRVRVWVVSQIQEATQ